MTRRELAERLYNILAEDRGRHLPTKAREAFIQETMMEMESVPHLLTKPWEVTEANFIKILNCERAAREN